MKMVSLRVHNNTHSTCDHFNFFILNHFLLLFPGGGVTSMYTGTVRAIFWGAFFGAGNKFWGIIFGKSIGGHKFWGIIFCITINFGEIF